MQSTRLLCNCISVYCSWQTGSASPKHIKSLIMKLIKEDIIQALPQEAMRAFCCCGTWTLRHRNTLKHIPLYITSSIRLLLSVLEVAFLKCVRAACNKLSICYSSLHLHEFAAPECWVCAVFSIMCRTVTRCDSRVVTYVMIESCQLSLSSLDVSLP